MTITYHITKANFLRLFQAVKSLKTHLLTGSYYKYEIKELNEDDKSYLLWVKLFLENPEGIAAHLLKVGRKDAYDYLLPPTPPAYHEEEECEKMHSSYFNLELPKGISGYPDRVQKCRNLFEGLVNQVERQSNNQERYENYRKALQLLPDKLKENSFFKDAFEKDNLSIETLTVASFEEIIRMNSGYKDVEMIMEEIDHLYDDFKKDCEQRIRIKGIKRPLAKQNIANSTFRNYKEQMLGLIIDYYIQEYNPSLLFDGELLQSLGFAPCYTCCDYRGNYGNDEEMELTNPLDSYIKDIENTYDYIECYGWVAFENTPETPLETIEDIKNVDVGLYYCLHKFTRKLQAVFRTNEGWMYPDLPTDAWSNYVHVDKYEVWLMKYKDLSESIKSDKKRIILVPVDY